MPRCRNRGPEKGSDSPRVPRKVDSRAWTTASFPGSQRGPFRLAPPPVFSLVQRSGKGEGKPGRPAPGSAVLAGAWHSLPATPPCQTSAISQCSHPLSQPLSGAPGQPLGRQLPGSAGAAAKESARESAGPSAARPPVTLRGLLPRPCPAGTPQALHPPHPCPQFLHSQPVTDFSK